MPTVLTTAAEHGIVLAAQGKDLQVKGPPTAVCDLMPALKAHKAEIIAELRRRQAQSHDDAPCECGSFGEHYDRGGSFDGWKAKLERDREARLSEWRVDCPRFVVIREAGKNGELAACLACGGTWELHGSPARELWRVADDTETVEALAVRFVLLAKAQAIAQPGDRP
ncbi:MAG: hypothetical protein ACYC8W_04680 [Candidatus Tyrphobacter sp.]